MNKSTDSKTIKDLISAIRTKDKKTTPYDAEGRVVDVTGEYAMVHLVGGVQQTPVRMTLSCKVGDRVKVRVSGGQAWISGNLTAPPTDDSVAKEAAEQAKHAELSAQSASDSAQAAQESADSAMSAAESAMSAAGEAQGSADSANGAAEAAQAAAEAAQAAADAAQGTADKAQGSADAADKKADNNLTTAKNYADTRDAAMDTALNQAKIFQKLTNDGEWEGLYHETDSSGVTHYYFNGSYIKAGTVSADRIDTDKLTVKAANIDGKLTASQINADQLSVTNGSFQGTVDASSFSATGSSTNASTRMSLDDMTLLLNTKIKKSGSSSPSGNGLILKLYNSNGSLIATTFVSATGISTPSVTTNEIDVTGGTVTAKTIIATDTLKVKSHNYLEDLSGILDRIAACEKKLNATSLTLDSITINTTKGLKVGTTDIVAWIQRLDNQING